MADCRSLIEFLRAFEPHRPRYASSSSPSSDPSSSASSSPRPRPRSRRASAPSRSRGALFTSLCDHSPLAAVDALVLLAALAALAYLAAPYAKLLALGARDAVALHPAASCAPLAAGAAAGAAALAWDAVARAARRCGRPRCRGLRRAVEFDIQLETEECVRRLAPPPGGCGCAMWPVELGLLGDAHRELEGELRRMAPPNGRTVLIFRAPCGCPLGRMVVWGAKKVRRVKK